jgi:glycosyltransferase involved in cell wall biosynthesis
MTSQSQTTVSVVIPAFNAEPWIGETLESVARQSYDVSTLEVLVVDDHSSDGTVDIATAVLKSGLPGGRIVRLPLNTGVSAARNIGWQQSQGRLDSVSGRRRSHRAREAGRPIAICGNADSRCGSRLFQMAPSEKDRSYLAAFRPDYRAGIGPSPSRRHARKQLWLPGANAHEAVSFGGCWRIPQRGFLVKTWNCACV